MTKIITNKNQSNTLQAFWVGIGSILSFGVNIGSAMILSRYFAKEDYGTYKQVTYVYNTLLVVFSLGLPKAFNYFLPRAKLEEAKSVVNKITGLLVIIGLVFSLSLFIFSKSIGAALGNEDLEIALIYFSIVPVLMLPTMGIESILSTYRKTQLLTFNIIINRLILFACIVIPVVCFEGDYILGIKGYVIGSIFNLLVSLWFKYLPFRYIKSIKTELAYSEIFNYTLPLFTASIWGVLIQSADQFFISKYFGREVFAEFSNGAIELPFVGMVVGAGSTVLGPLFSKQIHEKANVNDIIIPIWNSVFEKTVKIIYPLLLFTLVFSSDIIYILYGNQYSDSVNYFRLKLILNFFTMISFSPLILAMGETKYYSRIHAYNAALLWICGYAIVEFFENPYLLIVLSVFLNIWRILKFVKFIANSYKVKMITMFPIKLIFKILCFSVVILFFIKQIQIEDKMMSLTLSFLIYFLIYFIFAKKVNIDYIEIIKPIINRKND